MPTVTPLVRAYTHLSPFFSIFISCVLPGTVCVTQQSFAAHANTLIIALCLCYGDLKQARHTLHDETTNPSSDPLTDPPIQLYIKLAHDNYITDKITCQHIYETLCAFILSIRHSLKFAVCRLCTSAQDGLRGFFVCVCFSSSVLSCRQGAVQGWTQWFLGWSLRGFLFF